MHIIFLKIYPIKYCISLIHPNYMPPIIHHETSFECLSTQRKISLKTKKIFLCKDGFYAFLNQFNTDLFKIYLSTGLGLVLEQKYDIQNTLYYIIYRILYCFIDSFTSI